MKPGAFHIERLLAKLEAEVERRGLRARRYVFHPDEVAEAEAQGLPYALLPRVLSKREWMERMESSPSPRRVRIINDRTGIQARRPLLIRRTVQAGPLDLSPPPRCRARLTLVLDERSGGPAWVAYD